jgi:hypothetical protein
MGKRAINYLRLLQFGLTKKELDLLWKKHQYPCSLKIVSKTEEYAYIAVTYLLYQGDNAQFALDTAKVNVCRAYAHSQPEYQIAFDQMKKEILGDYAEFMSQT